MTATDGYTPSEDKAARTSLGDLLSEVSRDISTLMRQEIELAKAELTDSAKKAGTGAGMLGGAGYAALMAVFFVSLALAWALGDLFDHIGWGALIVALIWTIAGGVLYALGKKKMAEVRGAPRTAESLKKIPETLSRNEENR